MSGEAAGVEENGPEAVGERKIGKIGLRDAVARLASGVKKGRAEAPWEIRGAMGKIKQEHSCERGNGGAVQLVVKKAEQRATAPEVSGEAASVEENGPGTVGE